MSDLILIEGDTAEFNMLFGLAIVDVQPGTLQAGGAATLGGKKVCIEGDEANVEVQGCTYKTLVCTIPGTGTLKIEALGGDQIAQKTKSAGKAVLLKGSMFTATFEVQSPAKEPPKPPAPPTPDSMTQYTGFGMFSTTNKKWKGS